MKNKRIFITLTIIIILIHALGLFDAVNEKVLENLFLLNSETTVSDDIVIIAIDDKSIEELGNWPWKRKYYTKLINKLKNYPRVIGFTLSFNEKHNEKSDKEFYDALQKYNNVVLMAKYNFKDVGALTLAVPEKNLFPLIKHGHGLLDYSKKSVVVSIQPFKKYPAFALEVLNIFFNSKNNKKVVPYKLIKIFKEIENAESKYSINKHLYIDYKRTPSQFKRYSFAGVLNNKINLNEFKNKIVLVGLTDKYKTNTYITPFTGTRARTKSSTPVELQAQIIDSLMEYRGFSECSTLVSNIIAVILTIVFFILIKEKSILTQGLYLLLFTLIFSIIVFTLFKYAAIWLPPAFPVTLLIISFVLSEYFTTSKVEKILIETINNIQLENSIPLENIPPDIDSRATALRNLLEIINNDRQTIKNILEGVNNGIILLDQTGRILWANERTKTIFKNIKILKVKIQDLVEEVEIDEINEKLKQHTMFRLEFTVHNKDFICVFNALASKSRQIVAILNDISELKEIDRLKTDMVRMVSHELKNPLASIKLCAENIMLMNESEPSVDHARRIQNSSDHLFDTINDFLNLSKLEHNMMEINIAPNNLIDIIDKSIELQKTSCEHKNINMVLEKEDNIKNVMIDTRQILIVMNVLLSNAIKYSNNDSEIKITVENSTDMVKVSVIDYGIGIPPEDIDKIFEKFYRSLNNKERNIEGTGLGLTIVRRILDLHKGIVSVKSEVNKGSCFTFALPAAKD